MGCPAARGTTGPPATTGPCTGPAGGYRWGSGAGAVTGQMQTEGFRWGKASRYVHASDDLVTTRTEPRHLPSGTSCPRAAATGPPGRSRKVPHAPEPSRCTRGSPPPSCRDRRSPRCRHRRPRRRRRLLPALVEHVDLGERLRGRRRLRGVRHERAGAGRHGRAGGRREQGGRPQRHRAAARLGELRRHPQGLRGQVPADQGHVGAARREQQGRDQRGEHAEGQPNAPDVFDVGQSIANANRVDLRALQGRDLRGHPRQPQGPERRLDERLRRLHVDRVQRQGAPPRPRSPTCSSPSTRARWR